MAILPNTPTLSYIYIKDMVITYNDIPYQISNTYTQKPYIYWSIDQPYELIISNKILKEKAGLYYIIFNQKGNPTMVPQTDIEISFGEDSSRDLITEKILGFQTQNEINEEKFTTIQVDINGIKQTVGTVQEDVNGAKQTISEVNQKAENISASVSTLEREYAYNQELSTLREDTNIALLGLQSTLGIFSSDMNNFMEDNKLSDEESNQINAYKDTMTTKLNSLNTQIDKIISLLESQEKTEDATRLTTQKQLLNDSINNLLTNITTACTDDVFTNTEITTVVSYFANANTKINETNNMIDELIFLETGGALIEEISKLNISQNEIKLSVSKNEQTTTEIEQKLEVTVANVKVQYYLSTSTTELIGGTWTDIAPTWEANKYMWSKTVTTLTDGTIRESSPTCIAGAKGEDGTSVTILGTYNSIEELNQAHPNNNTNGDGYIINGDLYVWDGTSFINVGKIKGEDGEKGTGIESIIAEYYLSTSDTTQEGSSWTTTPPTWIKGTYIWTRNKITYKDPVSIEYTDPVLDSTWGAMSDIQDKIDNTTIELEETKKTVAEHTTSLNSITSRVSSTEQNITTIQNKVNISIKEVYTMYYLSTSSTQLIDGTWSRNVPSNISYNYLWTKTVTVYVNGTTNESDPICNTVINGESGELGEPGYTVILSDETFIVQCDLSGNPL